MLYYNLNWLKDANVKDIIIATHSSARTKIESYLKKYLQDQTDLHIRVVETSEESGSADVLRTIKAQINVFLF